MDKRSGKNSKNSSLKFQHGRNPADEFQELHLTQINFQGVDEQEVVADFTVEDFLAPVAAARVINADDLRCRDGLNNGDRN